MKQIGDQGRRKAGQWFLRAGPEGRGACSCRTTGATTVEGSARCFLGSRCRAVPLLNWPRRAPRDGDGRSTGPRRRRANSCSVAGGGCRLAIDLDDQRLAVVAGHRAVARVDRGRPRQAQDPLLDRRGRRRGPQEHPPEAAGEPETQPGGQPTEPADDQRAVGIARQAQGDIQGMHAGTVSARSFPAASDRHDTPAEIAMCLPMPPPCRGRYVRGAVGLSSECLELVLTVL